MLPERALLVSGTDKGRDMLNALVPLPPEQAKACTSGAEARREGMSGQYDAIIINTPLPDESGLDLAADLAQHTAAGVILLVRSDLADEVAARLMPCGALVVAKPVSRMLFDQALSFSVTARHRLLRLMQENEKLRAKLTEQKAVDRAKCLLIQHSGMTESEAHRHIEKTAMDTRQTRLDVARDLLAIYDQ